MLPFSGNIRNTLFLESFYAKFKRQCLDSLGERYQTTLNAEPADSSRPVQRPRPRIESLTDLVFGLALSIGAIGLISNRPKNPAILLASIPGLAFTFRIPTSVRLRSP